MQLNLNDDEAAALTRLLTNTIDADRYPLSPRIQTMKAILSKIRPEPVREPLPPPKVYAPPRGHSRQQAPGLAVAPAVSSHHGSREDVFQHPIGTPPRM